MKKIIFLLGILMLSSINTNALKLYLLSNHDFAGDHNQALGIATAFTQLSPESHIVDLNTKILSPSEIKEKITQDLIKENVIVIGPGEGGIQGIKELPKDSRLVIGLTSHMFLQGYNDPNILEKVTFIALPAPVPQEQKELLGNKLIETIGVAHNRQPETADNTYKEWGQKVLPRCTSFIGVVLGGDAPTPTKDLKLFTEKDATQLADYIAKHAKEACVLVLNGPRTGKHNAAKKEILTVHRKGDSDHITKTFVHELKTKGVLKVKVFDFQHNTPENKEWVAPYNAFDLVVGTLRAMKGTLFVPGESTSVISEAVDTLPPGKVIAYLNSAMNEVHHAQVASELAAGRVSVLENYDTLKTPPAATLNTPKPSAASTIAQRLREATSQNAEE